MLANKYERFESRITKSLSSTSCNLGDCEVNDEDLGWILSKLSELKHLTELYFENSNISDIGVMKIKKFCEDNPQIRAINLSRNKQITDEGAIALLDLMHVTDLSFYRNSHISDKFAVALLKATHIQKLDVRDTGISEHNRIEISRHLDKLNHVNRLADGSDSANETDWLARTNKK